MRTTLGVTELTTQPGQSVRLDIDVLNTGDIIDSIGAVELHGFPGYFRTDRPVVNLFPESADQLALVLDVPLRCPAGDYDVDIVLTPKVRDDDHSNHRLFLRVEPRVELGIELQPAVVTGGGSATMSAIVTNLGNAELSVSGMALEPTRQVDCNVRPNRVVIPIGEPSTFEIRLSGPRPWAGQAAQRTVMFAARVDDVIVGRGLDIDRRINTEPPAGELVGQTSIEAVGTFVQRPRIPRGVITMLTLTAIVALWSLIFVLVAQRLSAADTLSKSLATEFSQGEGDIPLADVAASQQGIVAAASTGEGVGRITVEALRLVGDEDIVEAGSVVTAADGSFTMEGLLPGRYRFRASGSGYGETLSPAIAAEALDASPDSDAAAQCDHYRLRPDASLSVEQPRARECMADESIRLELIGEPGQLSGQIQLPTGAPDIELTVRGVRLRPDEERRGAANVQQIGPDGESFEVTGMTVEGQFTFTSTPLTSPGTYEVIISGDQFEEQVFEQSIDGGDSTVINTVTMSAENGSILGKVVDADETDEDGQAKGLGGVTVVARSGDTRVQVTTPTDGFVGTFAIVGLPRPGTYVVTFSKPGFSEVTESIDLTTGAADREVQVSLVGGDGTLTGRTVAVDGTPIGGITVVVTGGVVDATTASLTGSPIGEFEITELPAPGNYTVTLSGDGFETESTAAQFSAAGELSVGDIALTRSTATVSGTVLDQGTGAGLGDVDVTLNNGTTEVSTSTATSPPGRFSFADVQPGSFTLTFSRADASTRVVQLVVVAGQDLDETVSVTVQSETDEVG